MDIEDSYDRLQLVCDWGLVVVVVVRLEFMGLHGFGLMATEPNLVLLLSLSGEAQSGSIIYRLL